MKFTGLIATCFVNRNITFTFYYYVYLYKGKKLSCMNQQTAIVYQVKKQNKLTVISLLCDEVYFWSLKPVHTRNVHAWTDRCHLGISKNCAGLNPEAQIITQNQKDDMLECNQTGK